MTSLTFFVSLLCKTKRYYSGIPVSRTSRGNANWFEKSGVKLQCLTEERERRLVLVIGRFEKMRVREIGGIPLYVTLRLFSN